MQDRAALVILTCRDSEPWIGERPWGGPVAIVALPSLLVLNENHLLHALSCGAAGVALVGCSRCHHGAPDLLATPLAVARALDSGADRLAYVEDDGSATCVEALGRLAGARVSHSGVMVRATRDCSGGEQ